MVVLTLILHPLCYPFLSPPSFLPLSPSNLMGTANQPFGPVLWLCKAILRWWWELVAVGDVAVAQGNVKGMGRATVQEGLFRQFKNTECGFATRPSNHH